MLDAHEFHFTDSKGTEVHLLITKNLKAADLVYVQKLINDNINYWINCENPIKKESEKCTCGATLVNGECPNNGENV